MRTLVWTLIVLAIPDILFAQPRPSEQDFSVVIQGGVGWNGPDREYFAGGGDALLRPGPSLGIGLEYGPVLEFSGTFLMSTIEIGYAEQKAVGALDGGEWEYGLQRLPILAGFVIVAHTAFSPFLKLGAGVARTDFRRAATRYDIANTRFHRWHFVWAAGGGVSYALSSDFTLSLYTETWYSEKVLDFNDAGIEDGIWQHWGFWTGGVRVAIAL